VGHAGQRDGDRLGPAGRLATEFLVEARSGGTCVVRLVSSAFGSGHDWDQELEDTRDGWRIYLRNLRLSLTDFPGGAAPGSW
jgi:hypothetical protein